MGEKTGIAWTDSTVNAWHGCAKVDALCKHCYAETQTPIRVKRANGLELWGGDAARSETKSWARDLRRWNREARASGKVHRVFAQSLSDTFENYTGGRVVRADGRLEAALVDLRAHFLEVVGECDALTFQMLTKRPENVVNMVPAAWRVAWPKHVWIGTSVGDQSSADERIPHLLRVPAPVRFLSMEPLLGPVRLRASWLGACSTCGETFAPGDGDWDDESGDHFPEWDTACGRRVGVDWVICGGESGPKARPFELAWARSLRDQCRKAGVAFFMKQLGARAHGNTPLTDTRWLTADSHGGDEGEWPDDLRGCRAFPEPQEVRS